MQVSPNLPNDNVHILTGAAGGGGTVIAFQVSYAALTLGTGPLGVHARMPQAVSPARPSQLPHAPAVCPACPAGSS